MPLMADLSMSVWSKHPSTTRDLVIALTPTPRSQVDLINVVVMICTVQYHVRWNSLSLHHHREVLSTRGTTQATITELNVQLSRPLLLPFLQVFQHTTIALYHLLNKNNTSRQSTLPSTISHPTLRLSQILVSSNNPLPDPLPSNSSSTKSRVSTPALWWSRRSA